MAGNLEGDAVLHLTAENVQLKAKVVETEKILKDLQDKNKDKPIDPGNEIPGFADKIKGSLAPIRNVIGAVKQGIGVVVQSIGILGIAASMARI